MYVRVLIVRLFTCVCSPSVLNSFTLVGVNTAEPNEMLQLVMHHHLWNRKGAIFCSASDFLVFVT